jgi:hypothetical protein
MARLSRGLFHKTFLRPQWIMYSSKLVCLLLSHFKQVSYFQAKPTLKGLHSGRLQPCLQILDLGESESEQQTLKLTTVGY